MNLRPVPELPEIREGDDIGELICERLTPEASDILTVASTIVSKAEGRGYALEAFEPTDRATAIAARLEAITGDEKDPRFAQAVLEESEELLMEAPFLLTCTHFGHIGVNAGIDRSNTGAADLLLLPEDPMASAARIRASLPHENPVIVTDTCGRPFRHGQTGVAIGWAGMAASRDWRGTRDRDGHELAVTVEAIVDEIAAASNVVAGEGAGGTPAVLVRGIDLASRETSGSLFREEATDFVRAALREWEYTPE